MRIASLRTSREICRALQAHYQFSHSSYTPIIILRLYSTNSSLQPIMCFAWIVEFYWKRLKKPRLLHQGQAHYVFDKSTAWILTMAQAQLQYRN